MNGPPEGLVEAAISADSIAEDEGGEEEDEAEEVWLEGAVPRGGNVRMQQMLERLEELRERMKAMQENEKFKQIFDVSMVRGCRRGVRVSVVGLLLLLMTIRLSVIILSLPSLSVTDLKLLSNCLHLWAISIDSPTISRK